MTATHQDDFNQSAINPQSEKALHRQMDDPAFAHAVPAVDLGKLLARAQLLLRGTFRMV